MAPQEHLEPLFGNFKIDASGRELWKANKRLHIEPLQLAILKLLYEQRERPVSLTELKQVVWKSDFVEDHTVQQQVSKLRRALDDPDGKYLQSCGKLGYMLVCEGSPLFPGGVSGKHEFSLIVDGMIINSVGELLHDDDETRPIRKSCRRSYRHSLEDMAFAIVYGSKILTSKDFRASVTKQDQPGQEVAVRLKEICEQRPFPQEVLGGALLGNETARDKIYRDIYWIGQCILTPSLSEFYQHYMVRESRKYLGDDDSLFEEGRDRAEFKYAVAREYYTDRRLQNALDPGALASLVRWLPEYSLTSRRRYTREALEEFATRNVLSLITIMWEADRYAEINKSWRIPHVLRALVRQKSVSHASTQQQDALRTMAVTHALAVALKRVPDAKRELVLPALLSLRDDYPFKEVRHIFDNEHLTFMTPSNAQEQKAKHIIRIINSIDSLKAVFVDRFKLTDRAALRVLGTTDMKEYETDLYRVFQELSPTGS